MTMRQALPRCRAGALALVLGGCLVATWATVAHAGLPAGTAQASPAPGGQPPVAACRFGAFVRETDPAGLNVRQSPGTRGRLLGTLPPVVRNAELGDFRIKVEVEVLAASQGWFQIRGARDNTTLTGKPARRVFAGQGWVSGQQLTAKSQARQAHAAPDAQSPVVLSLAEGAGFDADGFVDAMRLIDCRGSWALMELSTAELPADLKALLQAAPAAPGGPGAGRLRGWFNQLCAIQETSCSGSR